MTYLVKRLKEAAGEATPGPWEVATFHITGAPAVLSEHKAINDRLTKRDAAFIALANPANITSLCDTIEQQAEEIARLREALKPLAEEAAGYSREWHPDAMALQDSVLTVGDARRAAKEVQS